MNLTESIFGNPVTKLQEQSKTILDVFTKTVNDLEGVNADADKEITERNDIIKKATEKNAVLTAVKAKNNAVISKINKIFEDVPNNQESGN